MMMLQDVSRFWGLVAPVMLTMLLWASGCESSAGPCDGISCGDHGVCKVSAELGNAAYCECDEGYVSSSLYCLPETIVDGDAEQDDPEQYCETLCEPFDCGTVDGCNCGECGDDAPYCDDETHLCFQCKQKSDCPGDELCGPDHMCVPFDASCTSEASRDCLWNASWWKDSCGNWESLITECGDDECQEPYCSGNASLQFCMIRYCDMGECKTREQTETLENCGYNGCDPYECRRDEVVQYCYERGCSDGRCYSDRERQTVQDCGDDDCSDNYCDGYGSNWQVVKDCLKRGCEDASCYSYYETEIIETCSPPECGDPMCYQGDVVRECVSSTCDNGRCKSEYTIDYVQYCAGDLCSNGQCYGF